MSLNIRKVYEQNGKSNKAFYIRLPNIWVEEQFSGQDGKYVNMEIKGDDLVIKKIDG